MAESSMIAKRRKPEEEENDMIMSLPESVLCHILSFLSIETAVATSLVSRRWRHLWKHRQVFHFSEDSYYYTNQLKLFKKFAFFVNAVLSLRTSRDIREFDLHCGIMDGHKFPGDCVNMWICAAIGPLLQELFLRIANPDGSNIILLPSSLLNCTNLVSLSLVGAIEMKVQHSSVHFPSLKWLKLDIYVMDSDIAFLSGCPILETLHICFDLNSLTKVPVPPSSKRLKFNNGNFSWTCLEIDSNWLDEVHPWRAAQTTLGIIGNVHSIVEAYLDVFFRRKREFVDPILNRLQRPYNELYLQLRHSTKKWPLHAPVINNPEFCNLLHLKFILPCFNSNLLVNILEKCHTLQVLIIQINKEEPSPLGACELQSIAVPKCLESHLTYIHIEGYQGFEEELTFSEYILLNGLVLKTMLIFVDISMDITNKYRSLKRLTWVPKGSVTCQLGFDADVSP